MEKDIFITSLLYNLIEKANQINEKIYVVGGYVRNALLGFTTSDIDLAGTLTSEKIINLCNEIGYSASVISEKMGTVLIRCNNEQYEYTTFRVETYADGGKHTPEKVEFTDNMELDSKRRDFTVNAFYYNPLTKQVFDLNNGFVDLENKVIKCINSPQEVFKSDGLRILRFIRFACELNFNFDKNSYKVAKQQVHNLGDISKVRMLKELKEILNSDSKYSTYNNQHSRAIKVFNDLNIYKYLFNVSFDKFKIKTKGKLWKAFLKTTKQNRFYIFMVVVLFNYFKGKSTSVSNVHYVVNTLLGNSGLQDSNENINKIINLYLFFQTFWFLKPVSNDLCLKYNEFGDVTKQFFKNLNPKKVNLIEQRITNISNNKVPFKVGDLQVTNEELIKRGISPKLLGKIKVVLFNECLNERLKNEKETLIQYALLLNEKMLKQK